jgi:hypothetical protein
MTADQYLLNILNREAVDTGPLSPVRSVQSVLYPIIHGWAGDKLVSVHPSGSFMKGTANISGTDIDFHIPVRTDNRNATRDLRQTVQHDDGERIHPDPAKCLP